MTPTFQFQPFRRTLYDADELFVGFDLSKPETYAETLDVRIYQEFRKAGGSATGDYLTAMCRAIHDNAITQLTGDYIGSRFAVALMGGHGLARNDPLYATVARLSFELGKRAFLMLSGGGPGAMEAVHLGAAFDDSTKLDAALSFMAKATFLSVPPNATNLIRGDFSIDPTVARDLGTYLSPALSIYRDVGRGGGLGVPTWLYGHEPPTPLASKISKYFQNSIREDGMLALATHGIIYVQGSAGTMQEVFQDAAQNYYYTFPTGAAGPGYFSPMVFFGDFWQQVGVQPLLEKIFGPPVVGGKPNSHWNDYQQFVLLTSHPGAAIDFLVKFHPPHPNATLSRLQAQMK